MEFSVNNHRLLLDIRRDVQVGQGGTDAQHRSVSLVPAHRQQTTNHPSGPSKVSARRRQGNPLSYIPIESLLVNYLPLSRGAVSVAMG